MANDDIFQQADRLMKRHRVFVAAGACNPESDSTGVEAEELPILTEVVAESPEPPPPPALLREQIEALAREVLYERLPVQRQALADELNAWLDSELPPAIMRVLDGITDQLVAQVTLEAKAALLPRLQAALESSALPADTDG
jgi:hypothetical protein